MMNPGKIMGMV